MPDWSPTQSGGSMPPAWSDVSSPPPRRSLTVVLLLGVVLLIAALAGGGYLFLRGGLASSGTTASAPSPRPTLRPSELARLSPPTQSATPRPTLTSAPDTTPPPDADEAIDRFLDRITDADASYRLAGSGSVRAGSQEMAVGFSFDVAGADLSATMSFEDPTREINMRLIVKGKHAYAKVGTDPWIRAPRPEQAGHPFERFTEESWAGLEYVDATERGGKMLYRISMPAPVPLHLTEAAETLGCEDDDLRMDFWVRPNGVPVRAEYVMDCRAGNGGQATSATVDYDFSRFGERIRIERPDRFVSR